MPKMSFVATGDSFITRGLPRNPGFDALAAVIGTAEARFTNFEAVVPGPNAIPNAISGGTWAKAPETTIADLQALGFNLMSWANNHTLDFCHAGVTETAAAFDRAGVVHGGAGATLEAASRPVYLDAPSARVAMISICSTLHETAVAGQQRPDGPGRPGVNPLRFSTTWTLPKAQLDVLAGLAQASGINAEHRMRVKEGFGEEVPEGVVLFGNHRFREGPPGKLTACKQEDVDRTVRAIGQARRQGEFVVVSLHAHEMEGTDKALPARFLRDFAHACVDAGAHAVIGHGPHVLRGIEMRKGRPIFYSLGNFIFHNETVPDLPDDFYAKYGLSMTDGVADAIDKRSATNTRGFAANPWAWKSVIARWEMDGEQTTALELIPVELGYGEHRGRRGTPILSKDPAILPHLAELSTPFGTTIDIADGIGRVRL